MPSLKSSPLPTHDVGVSLPKNTKYESNRVLIRWLINGFMDALIDLASQLEFRTVLDVGCGEGMVLRQLKEVGAARKLQGVDLDPELLYTAQQVVPRADYVVGDIKQLPMVNRCFDLVLCTEVLEHLESPESALAEVVRVGRGHFLLSVPREPWWRLANMIRGKYLADWGNTPSHINHWSRQGFVRLVSDYLDVKAVRQPFPWTMVLGEARSPSSQ